MLAVKPDIWGDNIVQREAYWGKKPQLGDPETISV